MVSILINNYNYARFVGEAIESALAQDYPRVEVVVVDDGSTDGSREVIAKYTDQVTAVFQPNAGQAAAFNAGFLASRGDIICLLDADDRFRKSKVTAIVTEYRARPIVQWCFHPLALFGDRSAEPVSAQFPVGVAIDARAQMRRGKLRLTAPATSGLTFRRELLSRLLPMPNEIRITSDNYLKFAALGTTIGAFLAPPLAEQRLHGSNAYTLRSNADSRRGEVAMLTAAHLAERFPELTAFADGHFSRGLSLHISERGLSALRRGYPRMYLASRPLFNRVSIVARAVGRSAFRTVLQ